MSPAPASSTLLRRLREGVQRGLLALVLAVGSTAALLPMEAEAKRLGGNRSVGMQRQSPPPTTPQTPPKQADAPAAAAAPAAAGAAAAAGKRSWMGPLAGLAAGLGLAALMSHLGLGDEMASMLMIGLMVLLTVVAVRWAMRRFGGGNPALQAAGAAAGTGGTLRSPLPQAATPAAAQPMAFDRAHPAAAPLGTAAGLGAAPSAASAPALPEGFDAAEFTRIAKMIFIRMQAANDAGQVEDLRRFTTPELFAALRLDLHERGAAAQQTDVVQLDAAVVDSTQENGQWVVSVRFHGLIREAAEAAAEPFDELWHLVQPVDGSRDWAIAGITQRQPG